MHSFPRNVWFTSKQKLLTAFYLQIALYSKSKDWKADSTKFVPDENFENQAICLLFTFAVSALCLLWCEIVFEMGLSNSTSIRHNLVTGAIIPLMRHKLSQLGLSNWFLYTIKIGPLDSDNEYTSIWWRLSSSDIDSNLDF